MNISVLRLFSLVATLLVATAHLWGRQTTSGNPIFPGYYADPEAAIFGKEYWIYATYSASYDAQTYMDAFSSTDLVTWTKHPKILDQPVVPWVKRALWAPAVSQMGGRTYLFFAANDIQHDGDLGGIGIAVADSPAGPFHDYLGKPLIDKFYNKAQPIDPFVFEDKDGQHYLIYGGWKHCNIGKLKPDYTGFEPLPDGELFDEITPTGYVEGSCMFLRGGKYYFLWSEGNWTDSSYRIAYAIGDSPLGPFKRVGEVLKPDPSIGKGAGSNTVFALAQQDRWYLVYHRRAPGDTAGDARGVCVDAMTFNADGTIQPVVMTNAGVSAHPIP